ncbi:hypothetical protein DFH28DRAFT_1103765 [Melampsora americana]|nr:hypothetical protein DFH28DRAFT_1103765 [Melampsora americana]
MVGCVVHVLNNGEKWQAFVDALSKSTKKIGILLIENENVEVKATDDNNESAIKKLISQTNGHAAEDKQLEESKKDADQHGLQGYARGDDPILTTPWDPTFQYHLLFPASWIWAKAVSSSNEIKKTQWIHPKMNVDHWVKTQFQGLPWGTHGLGCHEDASQLDHQSEVGGLRLMDVGASNCQIQACTLISSKT